MGAMENATKNCGTFFFFFFITLGLELSGTKVYES